ncbi:unnamed protein product [Rotaria magnacalcarata]|uniref:Methyltransferase domain-containing protein n=1 Tax=Rotaria magnacalcarata TaxID=392030 RepID=A0A815WB36_9BILA|nr:unnamed protein product [Rotaria magnacalcarata]CAF1545557.1 unnamed protein product [Rotaria magnacalcarata]CAF2033178.1 unnamed protein product [Rotaria magnacalcarata]CAF2095670.1 unnamed protein product [Rotaria magnacalcarata]CAF2110725.1 unnamed protein product [Rotaria magnacalcarata]
MSTVRLLSDNFIQSFIRYLQWKHCFLIKLIVFLTIFISLITVIKNSSYQQRSLSFLAPKNQYDSLSPLILQNQIIAKLNLTQLTLVTPQNYLDPFVYSRIQFTHNNEQRTEASRKWCQAQSKFIRPQDLEPYKCADVKQFENSDHSFCLDPFVRNSCLIMSFGMGNNRLNNTFDNQLYDWGGCQLLTFDPYQQPTQTNTTNIMIPIKQNWTFYRIGLTASAAVDDNSNLMTIRKLVEYVHLDSVGTRIDILIIDIDNANEWNLLDDSDFILYLCRHVKQLIIKTKPIHSKRFQHYRIYTVKLNKCFSLLHRRSRLYLLGRQNEIESEWSLTTFSINLGLFCDEIDMSMYLLVYGHLYLVNTKL